MPFPYYNTASPTSSTSNNITDISTKFGIRDFLLNKNLLNPTIYPQLATNINGSPKIGQPVLDTSINNNAIIRQTSIEDSSLTLVNKNLSTNRYKDNTGVDNVLIDINYLPYGQNNYPLSTQPNGIDEYPSDIDTYGLLAKTQEQDFSNINTSSNLYFSPDEQIDMGSYISSNIQNPTNQLGNYLTTYGSLTVGSSTFGTPASDIIGDTFSFASSLASLSLNKPTDTNLGIISAQQLALALSYNENNGPVGSINLDPLSLIGGTPIMTPDYTITIPSSNGGSILTYSERILGNQIPISLLDTASSIFQSESNSGNIERANSMILNTGAGQVNALLSNINANVYGTGQYDNPISSTFRTGYAPGFVDSTGKPAINPTLYAFDMGNGFVYDFLNQPDTIPTLSYNRSAMIDGYGFTGFTEDSYTQSHIVTPTFTWGSSLGNGVNTYPNAVISSTTNKKNILDKTQILFNSIGMKTIVSTKGDMTVGPPSQIQTAVAAGGMSRGSAVKSATALNSGVINGATADQVFCRSWTTLDRYDSISKLIRSRGLNQNPSGSDALSTGEWRRETVGSVLDTNGFVKISPYATEDLTNINTKKYMFSIENLAWAGTPFNNLLPIEQGPGDLLSGKRGRIMWFPPYDIKVTDNNTVSLDTTTFIGRGEPLYTYNNTERTGSLSFKVIVDHPSILNSFAGSSGPADDYIDSYFAGCIDLDEQWANKLTLDELTTIQNANAPTIPQQKSSTQDIAPAPFKVYFENDSASIPTDGYESGINNNVPIDYHSNPNGGGLGVGTTQGEGIVGSIQTYNDSTNFGLNQPFYALDPVQLKQAFSNCPTCMIQIDGYASTSGGSALSDENLMISTLRATAVQNWFIQQGITDSTKFLPVTSNGATGCISASVDDKCLKEARYANVTFKPNKTNLPPPDAVDSTTNQQTTTITTTIKSRFYNETAFFQKLTDEDPFVFDSIRQKIKYFHPAFHSTTPEGFNARLTFLLQCTRQGPTLSSANPQNLAFGPPPVCILRVGDFYNTKIMMDNLNIEYEPLVWDLNPEGVGVQPMIANINISFKFIGGSTLQGPINKLQNALSFNYFANAQVYDARADYIDVTTNTNAANTYSLVNGLDMSSTGAPVMSDEVSITSSQVAAQTPSFSQTTNNETAVSSTVESPNTTQNDIGNIKLNNISIVSNVTDITSVTSISVIFTISSPITTTPAFKLMLYDNTGTAVGTVGVGSINSTDLMQTFTNSVNFTLQNKQQYYVMAKFTGSNKTIYLNT